MVLTRLVHACVLCGREVDRHSPTTLQINVFRGDQVPVREGHTPASTAVFFAHTRCFRSAMTPNARVALREFPAD